ncbi:DUF4192 domain-containing protein [Sphaerisporangium sp. B11E5]|uniref:DUF4192 domain-containing protein n=1 Tax=Sphaerisporangium sp. B11E5 TaxID=3153563 RepID=UPI00325E898A
MSDFVRVSRPSELVAMVPYLLGFHPSLSMVLIMLKPEATSVLATIRFDLPDDTCRWRVQELTDLITRNAVTHVVLVGYGPGARVTPSMDAVLTVLSEQGTEVVDALRVEEGRYWSYLCPDPGCCPPEGAPVDTCERVTAAAVVAGLVALPDRTAVAARLAPVEGEKREAMRDATLAAHEKATSLLASTTSIGAYWYAEGRARIKEALELADREEDLSDEQAAWLGILLTIIVVRDSVLTFTDFSDQTHLRLWCEVARRVEQAYVPAPATLAGLMALATGDGTVASVAVERALSVDPCYSFAVLLRQGLKAGIRPDVIDRLRTPPLAQHIAAVVTQNPDVIRPILRDITSEGR